MTSIQTTPERSALMRRVRREDTNLEQVVRRVLWSIGARYRVNVADLPGSPDVANKSRHKAIFVHGCFWHFHGNCKRGRIPNRNSTFWREKLLRNKERDERKRRKLEDSGFDVMVVWECQLNNLDQLEERLESFWFDDDV